MNEHGRPQLTQGYKSMMIDNGRWSGFEPRAGDIIVSTPPKAGTTWTQMICALLIFQEADFYAPLSTISPWLDMDTGPIDAVLGRLEAQTHRRFIKSHTPLDGLPFWDDVTYLCVGRDPRDCYLSMDNHFKNINPQFIMATMKRVEEGDPNAALEVADAPAAPANPPATTEELRARFHTWIADDGLPWEQVPPGASCVLYHVRSFWEFRDLPNIHMLHYSDLTADLGGEMHRLADLLGIEVDPALWPRLIEAATFDHMKERADELAPDADKKIWLDNDRFFDKGRSGHWQDILQEEELELYRRAMQERLEPDLARWLESGRVETD